MLRCAAFCAYVARPLTPQLPFLYEAKMVGVTLKTGKLLNKPGLEKVNLLPQTTQLANVEIQKVNSFALGHRVEGWGQGYNSSELTTASNTVPSTSPSSQGESSRLSNRRLPEQSPALPPLLDFSLFCRKHNKVYTLCIIIIHST